jgi:hypothetical protein
MAKKSEQEDPNALPSINLEEDEGLTVDEALAKVARQ